LLPSPLEKRRAFKFLQISKLLESLMYGVVTFPLTASSFLVKHARTRRVHQTGVRDRSEPLMQIESFEERGISLGPLAMIAKTVGCAAGYLKRRSFAGILEDLRQRMLRSPEGAIGGAILLGFLLGTSLRNRR
jgi:hypothetical protein